MAGLLEKEGKTSSSRLMSLSVVFGGLAIAFFAIAAVIYKGGNDIGTGIVSLVLGLVGLGLTGKAVKDFRETK
jgi:high-affinity Fe2+/Pb2+ permease